MLKEAAIIMFGKVQLIKNTCLQIYRATELIKQF